MTKEELNKKLEELRSCFGALTVKPTLGDLMAFFKESFNKDIVKVGDRLIFDFTQLFFMGGNKGELYKRFKGEPIQPITVTYIRGSVIFYTYDSEKNGNEEYMDYNSDWNKYLYLTTIKQSELFKNKVVNLAHDVFLNSDCTFRIHHSEHNLTEILGFGYVSRIRELSNEILISQ